MGATVGVEIQTDPNTVFQLFPSTYLTAGYQESYNLTGSDTLGGTHTGSYFVQTQSQTTFNGDPAIPLSLLLEWTNTQTNTFISIPATDYFSTSLGDMRYVGFVQDTTVVSATTSQIPQTGKIGDFGNVGTYTFNDSSQDVVTWRLTDGQNGRAYLVISTTSNDQSGNLDSSDEVKYLLAQDGTRLALTFRAYLPSEPVTITLSGNNILSGP